MKDIYFAQPGYFYLLLLIIPMVIWYILKERDTHATLQMSTIEGFDKLPSSYKIYLRHVLFGFRILIMVLLVFILARPQSTENWENKEVKGIDIIMAMDVSPSMQAQDFKPDRIEAAKDIGIQFISGRPDDRIGMVVFSGESFTQCPLTTDHAVVINLMKEIKCGVLEDGTAIGVGLANAVNRLKDSKAISKVIILLTDGVNNRGSIAPITAAELAKTYGIRVYTIGVGTMGQAPYPVQTPFGIQFQYVPVEIDEDLLRNIAQLDDGKYFRATDNNKLREIFTEIDKMEKTRIEVKEFSRKEEKYLPFAIAAALLLLLEIFIRNTVLKTIP